MCSLQTVSSCTLFLSSALAFVFVISPHWTTNPLRVPFSLVALNLWEQSKELALIKSIGRKTTLGLLFCSELLCSAKKVWRDTDRLLDTKLRAERFGMGLPTPCMGEPGQPQRG